MERYSGVEFKYQKYLLASMLVICGGRIYCLRTTSGMKVVDFWMLIFTLVGKVEEGMVRCVEPNSCRWMVLLTE